MTWVGWEITPHLQTTLLLQSSLNLFQTFEEVERHHWESMSSEWEREKQKILNALVGPGQDLLDFPQDTEVWRYENTFINTQIIDPCKSVHIWMWDRPHETPVLWLCGGECRRVLGWLTPALKNSIKKCLQSWSVSAVDWIEVLLLEWDS